MSDLHERCRKAEAEVAHLQRELTYAKNSFEAQKFLQHREWERAVQAERERDRWAVECGDASRRVMEQSRELDEARAEIARLRQERDETLVLCEHPDISNLRDLARELAFRGQCILELEQELKAEKAAQVRKKKQ